MPDLKNIRVRQAKVRDIGLFRKLFSGLLEQQAKEGSIVLANEHTLEFYETLFNAYVEGVLEGVVLFVADQGVLMWGVNGSTLDYGCKVAINWGCYVSSEKPEAISEALLAEAMDWMTSNGFKGLLTQLYGSSEIPEGYSQVATLAYKELPDE